MSAQLATSNSFSAHLALAAGVSVSISAPTLADLSAVVGKLSAAGSANDAPSVETRPVQAAKTEKPAAAAAHDFSKNAEAAAGNAPASTATPASAPPAASGSASAGDSPTFTYDDVKARVLALSKKGREHAVATLGKFKTVSGGTVDHGNKLQLQDYAAFIAAADAVLGAK